ncbi:CCA tRNA nucleotidyltransferase [Patescibacteria group bacterium]
MIKKIPKNVITVLNGLEEAGFEAYIVGGCVRDLIMDREPNDWDLTTSARPEQITEIFEDSFYENDFGTVGVKMETEEKKEGSDEFVKEVIEVTTFRVESTYSDRRRPDEVEFAKTLEEDLSRRDFTMNALALKLKNQNAKLKTTTQKSKLKDEDDASFEIVDYYGGIDDIGSKIIKTVGDANERFDEDALRMMRAVRFQSQLNFEIEEKTLEAIKKNAEHMEHISQERIRDEFKKIVVSSYPAKGVETLRETGLLKFVVPELEEGYGIDQNRHHTYTIYKHCLLSLEKCPSGKLEVRLAALFHDIAKPQTKRGEGEFATFYNHDHVGARVVKKILQRLKFSKKIAGKVTMLVDNHMFYYNPEEVGDASVRRLIKKVGLENMKDLIDLRISDRLGSGVPKAKPYKLRHLEYVVDKVSRDAVSVKMLKIGGNDLIKGLGFTPGPKIGAILDVLLAEVIEDTSKNEREHLLGRAKELDQEDIEQLRTLAKEKIEERKEEDDKELKNRHWVK